MWSQIRKKRKGAGPTQEGLKPNRLRRKSVQPSVVAVMSHCALGYSPRTVPTHVMGQMAADHRKKGSQAREMRLGSPFDSVGIYRCLVSGICG